MRLVVTWANPVDGTFAGPTAHRRDGPSRVAFDLDGSGGVTRLTVTHDRLADDAERDALFAGWAAVLSNLKTFVETGHALPTPPWEMLAGFRAGLRSYLRQSSAADSTRTNVTSRSPGFG